MAVPRRSPSAEILMLSCTCGAKLTGKVGAGKASIAIQLFEAHHRAPRCSSTWSLKELATYMVDRTARLSPDEVCASAPWRRRR